MRGDLSAAFPASAWRWGDYLLDPARRRLECAGETVAIEDRVFDLLALLLQHRERALDRSEIVAALWGKRPVGDATLRQLVYAARRAVGDDGEHQHTISTLYGRGLQWVAPVELVLQAGDAAANSAASSAALASRPQLYAADPAPPARTRLRGILVVMACLLLAAAGAGAWWIARRPHAGAHDGDRMLRVAIQPIENATGDASLAWVGHGLPGLLGSLLDEGGGVDVVDTRQVSKAATFRPTQGRDPARQLRFVTGADVLVGGRLRRLAERLYELELRIDDGSRHAVTVVTSGEDPGALAANAVRRIRRELGLAPSPAVPGRFPRDPLLMQAFARGVDLRDRGKAAESLHYFELCTAEAPEFLPCWLNLGIAQVLANAIAASNDTFDKLIARAEQDNDARMVLRARLWRMRSELTFGSVAAALDEGRKLLPAVLAAGDPGSVGDAHVLMSMAAHTLRKTSLAKQELAAAEAVASAHPEVRRLQVLVVDTRDYAALEDGDGEGALRAARESLALNEANGDERGTVIALGNVAAAMRVSHRDGEAIAVTVRALLRAGAAHFTELEAFNAGNLAISLLNLGLPEQAMAMADRFGALAAREGSLRSRVQAAQIRAGAQLQALDGASALATLRAIEALPGWDKLDIEDLLNQWLYEAMAAFPEQPALLRALQRKCEALAASREVRGALRRRILYVTALAQAADGDGNAAARSLRAAAAITSPSEDTDLELRMVPLLAAVDGHVADAAAIALKGYDPEATRDASLLRLYVKWMRRNDDDSAARRAEERLAALQRMGTDALAKAGFDPHSASGSVAASGSAD